MEIDWEADNCWLSKYLGAIFETGGGQLPDVKRRIVMTKSKKDLIASWAAMASERWLWWEELAPPLQAMSHYPAWPQRISARPRVVIFGSLGIRLLFRLDEFWRSSGGFTFSTICSWKVEWISWVVTRSESATVSIWGGNICRERNRKDVRGRGSDHGTL